MSKDKQLIVEQEPTFARECIDRTNTTISLKV